MMSDDPEGERPTSWVPTIVASGDTTAYETSDSLVFYLTRLLTPVQDAEIRKQIEEPVEYYEKRVWYYPWAKEQDGTLADVERIAYEASVEHRPKKNHCLFFVDRQAAQDGTVLIVECVADPETDGLPKGSIMTRGRIAAKQAPVAVVNSDLGNMELVEFLRGDHPEYLAALHFHHESPSDEEEEPLY